MVGATGGALTTCAVHKDTTVLPPYPRLVTELTTIKVNQQTKRSKGAYVTHVLQLDVHDGRYAKDEYGTKCNFYVHDVLHVMGYPVEYRLARQYLDDWRASSYMQPMVIEDAIHNANIGCPTVFGIREPDGLHSHVGVVLPQDPYSTLADLLVANVGASNFYGRPLRWAVAKARLLDVQLWGAP